MYPSWIELDKKAYKHNVRYLKGRLGKKTRFCSVIKGNAYGHGIEEFVPMAEECGIDYFAVYDVYEAKKVCKIRQKDTDIMIMGALLENDMDWVIKNEVSFFVFNLERLKTALQSAKYYKTPARIHIELETGMHRTGFEEEELSQLFDIINKNREHFQIEGVCTHYAGAESVSNYVRIQDQMTKFKEQIAKLREHNIVPKIYHTACSAAALIYPASRRDLVRFGIAQYGFWPSPEVKMHNLLNKDTTFTKDPLRRVLSWKSKVMSIKLVKQGEFINYGNSFLAKEDTKIATVPVGYYHGYRKSLGNRGTVLINGKEVRVIGAINMNMFIVNVTSLKNVKIGDEVVIIGKQGRKKITVASFADTSNLVNYELLARLPQQIPRKVID